MSCQVRKVIWDLFLLCPTPAAATSADVAAIQALIQPLGLFRKRAVAIQKLSRDYLEKQVARATGEGAWASAMMYRMHERVVGLPCLRMPLMGGCRVGPAIV